MPTWWEHLRHALTGRVSQHEDLPDVRHLPSVRVTAERTYYLVNDRERQSRAGRLYVLRREPGSWRDPASIAVYANGRSVGHLPAHVAVGLAPLLDRLGGAAIVNGAGVRHGSIRLQVDVPTSEALAQFVDAGSGSPRDH